MRKIGFTIWLLPFVLLGSFCLAQTVNDGPTPPDIQYQLSNSTLSANWAGFTTYATDNYFIEWAADIGFSRIVLTVPNIPISVTATSQSSSLTQGQTYYARVELIDKNGAIKQTGNSNGVTVDTTPPITGTVNIVDINGVTITTQGSITTIRASWSGFSDPESGIANYQWAIGSSSGGTDIQNYTNVGSSTSASNSNLNLTVGKTYFVTVIATNGAGLQSSKTSSGVTIVGGTVYDGATPGIDIQSQTSTTTIGANWSGFILPFSAYTMKVATDVYFSLSSTIYTQNNIPSSTSSITVGGLTLKLNTTYFVQIIAADSSGNMVEQGTSNGVTVISSPGPGIVNDGLVPPDINYQTVLNSISANWSGFSGVPNHYTFTVFQSTNMTTPFVPTQILGNVAVFTFNSALVLTNGSTYFVQIQAADALNNVLETEMSNGVTVDNTPPVAGRVFDGNVPQQEISTQISTTAISANWFGFNDPESGINHYEWAVGTTPGGIDITTYTNIGAVTTYTNSGLSLTNGAKYYVTVRATNGAGATVVATSSGVTVNTSGPTGGIVNDGSTPGVDIDFQASTTQISANWSGFTFPNGLSEYLVSVGTYSGGTNVYPLKGVGQVGAYTINNLALSSGTKYFFQVVGKDILGLTTIAVSNGVTVDATPPVAGTVSDGPAPLPDIDSQFSTTNLSANWSGFSDAISGLNHYEWAIGTTPGGTNAKPYTNVGLVTTATDNTLSLIPGQRYYSSIKAVDNVGNFTIVSSNGVTISGGPPVSSGGGGSPGGLNIGLGSLGSASCGSVGLDYLAFVGIVALVRKKFRRFVK